MARFGSSIDLGKNLGAVGNRYQGFVVTKVCPIPELQCVLRELVHEETGAHIMHIANDDPENLFCLSFRTLPDSSNGVAHILEHTVLCGSERFPVKDPFFAMTRRSLNTFMNALTGADFTCYPAASQVPADFYNLLDVYIDAVFHPLLNELSFLQEGHRLEFETTWDKSTNLHYKGIVYNEMKGALSSATSRLSEAMNESLYPNITYGQNSGGDPKVIPSLKYQELIDFHRKYYHPSRCLFFFYGNLPLEDHLDFIAEKALKNVKKEQQLPPLPPQPRYKEPIRRNLTYPISLDEETSDKSLVSFGWLTCHLLDQQETLALDLLEIVLMDTDASPLKMALLRSGMCKQVSSYIDDEISEIPWIITLKGCNPQDADKLEALLRETLLKVIREGISDELIENAIHQLEFFRSEITGDHAPFGLSLFMRSGLLKQHGAKPEESLMIHSLFEALRKRIADNPQYLTGIIQKYLVDNTHFVRIVMEPDPDQGARENREEHERLKQIRDHLSEKQKDDLVNKGDELLSFQKKQEEDDIDVLPKVSLTDVSKKSRNYSLKRENFGRFGLYHHACFTNEIVYADLVFDLPYLTESDLIYVRLLTILWSQVGCKQRDYRENLDYIQGNTGGIGASLSLNLQANDHTQFYPSLHIRGKALHRKIGNLFSLLVDMITGIDFTDIQRLKEIILKHFTALDSSLNQNSLKYAINLSSSGLNVPSKIANDWFGLEYYWMIRDLAKNFDDRADELVVRLQDLHDKLVSMENPDLVITCDEQAYELLKRNQFYGLDKIKSKPQQPWKGDYPLIHVPSQARIISSPIAFIGKVFNTVSYSHLDAPALNIASSLLDNTTLHRRIREQGGAYGGGAVSNALSGNFYFYSYRDPNITSTLNAFEESIKILSEGDFDESDLEEAKLEMIQSMDSPVAPGSRGALAYSWLRENRTIEIRQAFRTRLLSLEPLDIIRAVRNEIIPNVNHGATVIFAGRDLINREAKNELEGQETWSREIHGI